MLASRAAASSDTFEVTTPSDKEISMTRTFDAPRELVFEAMTRPEHVKRWWGCLGDGYSVPVCEIDLRVGGKWRFVNRHPNGEAEFYGEYREIAPPGRGEPTQPHGEDQDEHDAEPERGHRLPEKGDHRRDVVHRLVAAHRGDDARGDGKRQRDGEAGPGQLEGGGQTLGDERHGGLAVA